MELHVSPAPQVPAQNPGAAKAAVRPRAGRGGWSEEETRLLWQQVRSACAQGEPLRDVFERVAASLGRKPNSIRNYYYAQLKERDEPELHRALPFETFTDEQVRALVRTVLQKKGEGMSVRACVTQMAQGDKSLMLRYQNKYRSTLRARPELVREVMDELKQDGQPCADPYAEKTPCLRPEALLANATERVERMGEPALFKMLEGMNTLIDMALKNEAASGETLAPAPSATQDALDRALLERDRLSARNDLLRIALDDERQKTQSLQQECAQLVLTLKEFIGQSGLARTQCMDDFCRDLSGRLSSIEQALPFARQ